MTHTGLSNSLPPTHVTPRDGALDGLRGLAVLAVYLFHYGGGLRSHNPVLRLAGYATQAGWVGVELFFALSGFLITGLLWTDLQQNQTLGGYFQRRARRILPVYYGALLVAGLAALLWGASAENLQPLLVYAAFAQNLPPLLSVAMRYPAPLPLHHLWTVAVEAQFYLIWPTLLLLARTRRRALQLCGGIFLLSCLFRLAIFWPQTATPETIANWSPFLLTRAGGLALGSALALLDPAHLTRLTRRWVLAALLGSAGLFAAAEGHCGNLLLASPAQFILALPAVETASAALLVLALQPGIWRTGLSLAPLRWLGRISYGFYVLHILLEPLFDRVGAAIAHAPQGSTYLLVRVLVAFPVSAAAAWLSFTFLEQPIRRLRTRPASIPLRPRAVLR